MAKDRLADTWAYLHRQAIAHALPHVGDRDVTDFERLVANDDRTNGGAVLSLDWSWYNSRPSEDNRHAIRAYLMASIYSGDIQANATRAAATLVKNETAQWLHRKIAKRLVRVLGLSDPMSLDAIRYVCGVAGHGTQRATGVCKGYGLPLEQLMPGRNDTAIVLIDMQAGGDIGQHRYYGDRTVLEHQQAVLREAARLNWVVYDIVIDQADAAEWGNPYGLGAKLPEAKIDIVARQRRGSYAEGARTKTIGVLRDLFVGARVRHIPKPTHPAFAGTLFGEHLEADGVDSVIVMGYDANQCVKATVFGVPGTTRDQLNREPTSKDLTDAEELTRLNRGMTAQAALKQVIGTVQIVEPYEPGLLDRGIKVITARCVLASGSAPLDPEWAMLSGRR